ncbi:hypothetical protein JCM5353_008195 [Sporobolomyces roseus]
MSENTHEHFSMPSINLANLPFDLLDLIASHLERQSLARLSLVSKVFKSTSYPKLFKHLVLEERLEEVVNENDGDNEIRDLKLENCLAVLSRDKYLCMMIQSVSLFGTFWIRDQELIDLHKLLVQANIKQMTIEYRSQRLVNWQLAKDRIEHSNPVIWQTVSHLPLLNGLALNGFGGYDLNLQLLPALASIRIDNLWMVETDGTLPSTLTQLSLVEVGGVTSSWLIQYSLCRLKVLHLQYSYFEQMQEISTRLSFVGPPFAMHTLLLQFDDMYGMMHDPSRILNFSKSFRPRSYPNLHTLEIHGIDITIFQTDTDFLPFLRQLSTSIPTIRELTLMLATSGSELVQLRGEINLCTPGSNLPTVVASLAELDQLEFLTINFYEETPILDSSIQQIFTTFPSLRYFTIRPTKLTQDSPGFAWIIDDTDQESKDRRPVSAPSKKFLVEALEEDPTLPLEKDYSLKLYRDVVRKMYTA